MISDTHDEVRGKWLENEKISMDILSPHFFNCIFRKKRIIYLQWIFIIVDSDQEFGKEFQCVFGWSLLRKTDVWKGFSCEKYSSIYERIFCFTFLVETCFALRFDSVSNPMHIQNAACKTVQASKLRSSDSSSQTQLFSFWDLHKILFDKQFLTNLMSSDSYFSISMLAWILV